MESWYLKRPFAYLPESNLRALKQAAEAVCYPKGAVLFHEGNPARALWVLRRGWVYLTKQTVDNRTMTLDLVTPKDNLCGLSAFSGQAYLATAIAAIPVETVRLPASALCRPFQTNAKFAACVMEFFSHRFHHMAAAYATAFAPVEQRIASVLLRLKEDFGTILPVTRREIAQLTGTTVETAIRVTSRMRREGLIRMSRCQVTLIDPRALARRLQAG